MKLFLNQIEARRKLERTALDLELEEGAERMGLKRRAHASTPHTGNVAIHQILQALNITEYELEDEELVSLEDQLKGIVRQYGIMMREVELKDGWWKESVGPMVGRNREGQLLTLLPTRSGRNYRYMGADGRWKKVSRKDMQTVLADKGFLFSKALPLKKLGIRHLLTFILKSIWGHSMVYMVLAALMVVLLGMFTPMANKLVFETVIPTGIAADLAPIAGLLVGAGIASVLMVYIRNIFILRVENIVEMDLHNAIMGRMFYLSPQFFSKNSSGTLTAKLNNLTVLCQQLNETIVGALLSGVLSVIYFVQVWLYGGQLLWPALLLFGLQTLIIVLYYRVMIKLRKDYTERNDQLGGMECNLFAGMQKIKVTGSELRAFTQWLNHYTKAARIVYNPVLGARLYPALMALLNIGGMGLLYWWAVSDATHTSDFIAFITAFGMMTASLSTIAAQIPMMSLMAPLLNSIRPILEAVPEIQRNSTQVPMLFGNIEIKGLSFRYQEDMPLVLDNLSLSIKPGEYIGIVGKSGCGKSTLMRLLLGFEKPLRGSICYDNFELDKVDKSQLRRRIGTCLQNGSLFVGELLENITITAPWATQDDAWDALRQACMYDEVKALPMGLHTIITEGGGGFSGGQKQRLLIARALISKPNIIFFDEATSALDNISQKQVSDNLDKLHCTRVVIAHRLSTIRHCDRIIVLDKGHIAEEGNFEELMSKKGLFYEMSLRQL